MLDDEPSPLNNLQKSPRDLLLVQPVEPSRRSRSPSLSCRDSVPSAGVCSRILFATGAERSSGEGNCRVTMAWCGHGVAGSILQRQYLLRWTLFESQIGKVAISFPLTLPALLPLPSQSLKSYNAPASIAAWNSNRSMLPEQFLFCPADDSPYVRVTKSKRRSDQDSPATAQYDKLPQSLQALKPRLTLYGLHVPVIIVEPATWILQEDTNLSAHKLDPNYSSPDRSAVRLLPEAPIITTTARLASTIGCFKLLRNIQTYSNGLLAVKALKAGDKDPSFPQVTKQTSPCFQGNEEMDVDRTVVRSSNDGRIVHRRTLAVLVRALEYTDVAGKISIWHPYLIFSSMKRGIAKIYLSDCASGMVQCKPSIIQKATVPRGLVARTLICLYQSAEGYTASRLVSAVSLLSIASAVDLVWPTPTLDMRIESGTELKSLTAAVLVRYMTVSLAPMPHANGVRRHEETVLIRPKSFESQTSQISGRISHQRMPEAQAKGSHPDAKGSLIARSYASKTHVPWLSDWLTAPDPKTAIRGREWAERTGRPTKIPMGQHRADGSIVAISASQRS
ncbi:hypothetical protein G7Y89_g15230 [Cudoniella acicularis]|uniref:Uncharacterized protein n=1 Tax=Cudoniella acicularis TaxID=354080 RepID=A0A8H4VPS6_9HELO|nr:hypothetical protein G7Y89_g15230 [Cudoniella acicularis]